MDRENPLGIKALDHLQFTVADFSSPSFELFLQLGFSPDQKSPDGNNILFQQGQSRFVMTKMEGDDQAQAYLEAHGEGVCKLSFWVENLELALSEAEKRGAKIVRDLNIQETEYGPVKTASIQGFGDVHNEFVERPAPVFRPDWRPHPKTATLARPLKVRASRIDHLTNNVPKGEMDHWVDFYKRIFGMVETRYFDIKGAKTGLQSKVVQLKNNSVIIPINEPDQEGGKSQIQEFLDRHRGAGVQHIALMTPDIIPTVAELRSRDIHFLDVPDTYYEDIPKRPFMVEEDLNVLQKNKILVDGDLEGYLLQIFSETYIGPLFFEYIQRKNHWGFGEGNFNALFTAIERDQERRGYL